MALIDSKISPRATLIALVLSFSFLAGPNAQAARDPNCVDQLTKERKAILDRFGKLRNYKTYTDAKARALQDRIEKYLISIGDVLKNFKVETFLREALAKLPAVKALSKADREALEAILAPAFESRRLPSMKNLRRSLVDHGLGDLPYRKIRDTMDRSFRIWRTKLVFEETGRTVYNQLAKAFVEKGGLGEFSMQVGLLGKNEWEAFFESEKGKGIFNPSMPGMMSDLFTSTEAHEAVHMTVESLAAEGHDSPYAVWVKIDKGYKKTGAIGDRQMKALQEATDPLSDGDYYRNELYLDEFPAHVIQSAYLNVELSKALHARFRETIDSVRSLAVKDELEDAFAEYLREGKVDWTDYSDQTMRVFEGFLKHRASDGRTKIAKLLGEMTEYLNWIDLIQNNGSTAVYRARQILDEEVAKAKAAGRKGIPPRADGPIQIKADTFLGVKGYKIEVRIPVDVLQADGTFRTVPGAASVNFRFTKDGDLTKTITADKIAKLVKRTDWVAELAEKSKAEVEAYAKFLDENGYLQDYTFADVFALKHIHTRLRKLTRETMERIRASK